MNKKLKTKWVKALRSGRYQQGQCLLYNTESKSYCCLGVLGRVMGKSTRTLAANEPASSATPKGWKVLDAEQVDQLINLNDITKRDFHAIADYIEANL